MWKSNLFDSSSSFFFQPNTTNPKCKPVILVFKSKKKMYCMYFTILQRGSLEESVTKNTFNSILILCLYKFRSGYMQIIQIFFTKQEYILSVLIGGGNFSAFDWIFYLDQNRIPIVTPPWIRHWIWVCIQKSLLECCCWGSIWKKSEFCHFSVQNGPKWCPWQSWNWSYATFSIGILL